MSVGLTSVAMINLGGGEIILVLGLLLVLAVLLVGVFGLIYLIVRSVQSPPSLATLPPNAEDLQALRRKDLEHLKILAVFHFVFAALAILGMVFIGFHYFMMHSIFANPDMWKNQRGAAPPPPQIFNVLVWIYVFGGIVLIAGLLVNALSGMFLLRRKYRLFSMVIAGLNCLQIPFGTALGVFTIIVLCKDSVRELYGEAAGQ